MRKRVCLITFLLLTFLLSSDLGLSPHSKASEFQNKFRLTAEGQESSDSVEQWRERKRHFGSGQIGQGIKGESSNVDFIGIWPYGACRAVALDASRNIALIGNGDTLQVLDISTPSSPSVLGEIILRSTLIDISISGNYACVLTRHSLRIIDITTLSNPTQTASVDVPAWCNSMAISSGYAYVAGDWSGLMIYDISTPTNPFWVGTYSGDFGVRDVSIWGNYAFIINDYYTGSDWINQLRVINVTTPSSPSLTGTYNGEIGCNLYGIDASNGYAFISQHSDANNESRITIINVAADPTNPSKVGEHTKTGVDYVDVAVSGNYAYAYSPWGCCLAVLDISIPSNPSLVGEVSGTCNSHAYKIAVSGNLVGIAHDGNGLALYDVSDPNNPYSAGTFDTPAAIGWCGNPVKFSAGYAYMSSDKDGVRIIDVSDPSSPFEVGVSGDFYAGGGIDVSGNYTYCVSGWGLSVVDVSSSNSPFRVSNISFAHDARDVAVQGNYTYVSGLEWHSGESWVNLYVVDISDPLNPSLVGYYVNPNKSYSHSGIAVSGNYVYIAFEDRSTSSHKAGLKIIDVSIPTSPTEVGSYLDTAGYSQGLALRGDYVYLSGDNLRIIDVSNPLSPSEVSTFPWGGQNVAVSGKYVYIEDGWRVSIIDVSDPYNPTDAGYYEDDPESGLAVSGNYIYYPGSLTVLRNTLAPEVSISNPLAWSTLNGTVSIEAGASHSSGIATVEFYIDDSIQGSDSTSPYSFAWDTNYFLDGPHKIRARAHNNNGKSSDFEIGVTVRNSWNLAISSAAGGGTDPVSGNYSYSHGTVVQVTAIPNIGYVFTSWTGSVFSANNPLEITMNSDKSIMANFAVASGNYQLIINAGAGGTTNPAPGDYSHPPGTVTSITAIPDAGSSFLNWTGDVPAGHANDNPLWITMDSYKSITPHFTHVEEYYVESQIPCQYTGGGTAQNLRGDDYVKSYPLPFDFPYFREVIPAGTNIYICTNGFIDFAVSSTDYTDTVAELISNKRIAVLWQDLKTNGTAQPGEDVYITVNPDKLIIRWVAETLSYARIVNIELILYTDGRIQFNYDGGNDFSGTSLRPTIGISKGDGLNYDLSVYNEQAVLTSVNSDLFTPTGPDPSPTVSIDNPSQGETVSGVVNIEASASDNSSVVKVEFYIDGQFKFSKLSPPPYSYTWDTTVFSDGSHVLKAVAYDNLYQTGENQISVTVDNFILEVNPSLRGSTSPGSGIHTFAPGTVVSITATPNSGYEFSSWSGNVPAGHEMDNPLEVTMDRDRTITPNFNVSSGNHELVINASPGGTTSPVPGAHLYTSGTKVMVTATPDSGYRFTGWAGNIPSGHGMDNPIEITVDSNKSITANFIAEYTLSISSGTGGTTNPVPGNYVYDSGTEVTVTAVREIGYGFSGWTGDVPAGHENDNPLILVMDGNKSVTANFFQAYELTVSSEAGGTTNPAPGSYWHSPGTQVSVTAVPDIGFRFNGWTGAVPQGQEMDNPVTLTMDKDRSVTANFAKVLILNITAGVGGTTDPAPGSYTHDSGEVITATAIPNSGYVFTHWSGDISGSNNPVELTMDSDKSVMANFSIAAGNFQFIINAGLGGTTNPGPGAYSHSPGTQVCVTAIPDAGSSFLNWTGDVPSGHESDNPVCITIDSAKSITPHFKTAEDYYKESKVPHEFIGGGTAQNFKQGDAVMPYTLPFDFPYFGATIPAGTQFYIPTKAFIDFAISSYDWTDTLSELISNKRIAIFWEDLRTNGTAQAGEDIYITVNPDSFIIRWAAETFSYQKPVNVEIVLYTDGRIKFNYGGGNNLSGTSYEPTIGISKGGGIYYNISDYNEQITLTNVDSYLFTPKSLDSAPAVSIVHPSQGETVAGEVDIEASASDDDQVTKVEFYINGELKFVDSVSPYLYSWDTTAYSDGSYALKAVAYDSIYQTGVDEISVDVDNYVLVINETNKGTTNPGSGTYKYAYGTEVLISATPNTGYEFNGWTGDVPAGHEMDNPVSIIMDADKSITPNFSISAGYYELIINANPGGTTNPSPSAYAHSPGTQVSITAIADTGYRVYNWTGDVPAGHEWDNPVQITVDRNKSITANFMARYTLNLSAGTEGTTDPAPGSYTYDVGTEVSIAAVPNAGYRFNGWTGNIPAGHEMDNPLSLVMDSTKNIAANFIVGTLALTVQVNQAGRGTVAKNPDQEGYNYGQNVELTANPNSGYVFSSWSGDIPAGHENDNPLTIAMTTDKTVTANFDVAAGNYELIIKSVSGGTTDPVAQAYSYAPGTEVCVTANPNSGWYFLHWTGDVPSGHGSDNPLCITMDSNKMITPVFSDHAWTFMVYLDGDNNLEQYAINDFLEMASVGSNDEVNIVVQLDRVSGYDSRYDNWTSTKRFYVTNGMTPAAANALQDLGELNHGNPQTLVDFVNWAKDNYKAKNYALILWNHGGGWRLPPEELAKAKSEGKMEIYFKAVCWDDTDGGDSLYTDEVQSALNSTGRVSLICFNASLMGMVEVAYEMRNHSEVMVGSEETIPGNGWPYNTILQNLANNSNWSSSEFGQAIVDRYYESYSNNQTLTAVDLYNLGTLASAISSFAQTMIDNWNTNVTAVKNAAEDVKAKINDALIHEQHGSDWPGAHGLAVYFPENSGDFNSDYNGGVIDFASDTKWEEFLQQFYSSMAGSWIFQRRAISQAFYYGQHIDLYHFCELVAAEPGSFYGQSLVSHEFLGGGTALNFHYNEGSISCTLPFNFPYFGETIPAGTYIYASTNGFVDFTDLAIERYNSGCRLAHTKRIAVCWSDLTTAGSVQTGEDIYRTSSSNRLVIRWRAQTYSTARPVNVELVLYNDGRIQINYGDGNSNLAHWETGLGPTIGISKGDGVNCYIPIYNGQYNLTNVNSVLFTPGVGPTYYILSISSSHGGTTNPAPGNYQYGAGSEVSVTAQPNLGYVFSGWTGDVPSGQEMNNPITIVLDADKSIAANFAVAPGYYELIINSAQGGTINPAPGAYSYSAGTQVCITATANPRVAFSHWAGDVPSGHEQDNPLCVTMNSNRTITPVFEFEQKWTFMVYLDGDNNLEQYAVDDFLEMVSVGSTSAVNIVVQLDRIGGYDTRYDNWTTTKRFYVTNGITPTAANALQDLGELNHGNPQTLIEFINWAKSNYPANNYALILWNHGGGWRLPSKEERLKAEQEGKKQRNFRAVCWDDTSGEDTLYTNEVQSALSSSGGVHLIGFDACLMGMAEVAYEMRDIAEVMVGSEEVEPGEGWPYTSILQNLTSNPAWSSSELAQAIVDRYYESYSNDQTMAAIRLENQMSNLASAISSLAQAMIDDWNTDKNAVKNAAQSVMSEIESTVIRERHGSAWPGAHGLAVYFPGTSGEFNADYNGSVIDFAHDTQWDEFINEFHSSMAGSWIGTKRACSQEFEYPQHIDLVHFCELLNTETEERYEPSQIPPKFYGGGTSWNFHYDDATRTYSLPFNFPYFREVIPAGTTIYICTNGYIDFANNQPQWENSLSGLARNKRIAVCWTDLVTNGSAQAGEDVYISRNVSSSKSPDNLVIRWAAETLSTGAVVNVELVLYSDGKIQFNYGSGNANFGSSKPTIGVSKGDGTFLYLSSYNGAANLNNVASEIFTPYMEYNLVISASAGGTTDPPPGTYAFEDSEQVTIRAVPDTANHYDFKNWTGASTSQNEQITITMNSDKFVQANFIKIGPASNFAVTQEYNRSLLIGEYINVLTWQDNPANENIAEYKIYEVIGAYHNLLATIDTSTSEYWHRKVDKDQTYVYALCAVNTKGREGEPAYASFLGGTGKTKDALKATSIPKGGDRFAPAIDDLSKKIPSAVVSGDSEKAGQTGLRKIGKPLKFTAQRKTDPGVAQPQVVNILTWQANPENQDIVKYRIYQVDGRKKKLLAELNADVFEYHHRDIEKNKRYRYGLAAVNKKNSEGEIAYAEVR